MNEDRCGNCIELEIIGGEEIELEIIGNCEDIPEYDGPYTVRPKAWEAQELETQSKIMTQNVTVTEIPYARIPTAGTKGTTIVIAS